MTSPSRKGLSGDAELSIGNRHSSRHPDTSKDLWSPPDVADYLGLANYTIYAMLARGEIPGAIRLGRHWKVSVPALMRALHGESRRAS